MELDIDPDDETPEARLCRVVNIVEALPSHHRPSDDTPLRQVLPGAWPTYGDLKRFAVSRFETVK